MAKQETKPNSRTDVNPDERAAEIEEAARRLDASVLAQKATKLSPNGRSLESKTTNGSG